MQTLGSVQTRDQHGTSKWALTHVAFVIPYQKYDNDWIM